MQLYERIIWRKKSKNLEKTRDFEGIRLKIRKKNKNL